MTRFTAAAAALFSFMLVAPLQAQEADPTTAAARRFVELLKAADWPEAAKLVAPTTPAVMQGPGALSALWGQVKASVGELQSLEFYRSLPVDSSTSVEFVGRFGAAGQRLTVRVVMSSARQVTGFWLAGPPAEAGAAPGPAAPYIDASKFREEAAEFGLPAWRLPATVAVPTSPGRHPAVVLVHGSGAQDRDETLGPNKPFRDLARGLASQGVLVLRYDKRTLVHGAKLGTATVEAEVIDDALLALELVRSRPDVDPSRVYLLGHSLGGQLGPAIAERDKRLAGLILFAAPARPLPEVILDQLAYLETLPQNQVPAGVAQINAMRTQVTSLANPATPDSAMIMGAPASYFRGLAKYDAVATAKTLQIPILVLNGERDYQVTQKDFELWTAGLAGRSDVTLKMIPKVNHAFLAGEGPPSPADYNKAGFVAAEAITAIRSFIR